MFSEFRHTSNTFLGTLKVLEFNSLQNGIQHFILIYDLKLLYKIREYNIV